MPADKAIFSVSRFRARSVLVVRAARVDLTGLALAVLLAACGGGLAPLYNVRNAPVVTGHGQIASAPEVRDAIMRALVDRGWQVDREGPDGIVATQVSRGHNATVLIQYNPSAYSISYLDSSPGLKFDGSAIHRRYNEWVERLDKTIRKLLASGNGFALQVAVPASQAVLPPAETLPAAPYAPSEPAPATAPMPAPPPAGAPPVAPPTGPYAAPPPPPPPPPATAPRR